MRGFPPHPNPLPMNLALRCLIAVKSIVAKFMGRGDKADSPVRVAIEFLEWQSYTAIKHIINA